MRRLMFALSLIAILTATPLRLAEAAEDLARSLAELGNGVNLEEVDGGVGDDSGATIKADVVDGVSSFGSVDWLAELPGPACSVVPRVILRPDDSRADPTTNSARRRAWLQRFLC